MILPVDGTAKQTSWVVGQEVDSFEVDFKKGGGNMIEVKHIWFSMSNGGEFVLKDISFRGAGRNCRGSGREWCRARQPYRKILGRALPPRPERREPERGVRLDGKPIRECNAEIAFISEDGTYLKDLTPGEYGAFRRLLPLL